MTLTVRELIEKLQSLENQDAEIRIMSQPGWPFEYDVDGVVTREEITQAQKEEEGEDWEEECQNEEKNPDDVFLVEGSQLCYGDKKAWDFV